MKSMMRVSRAFLAAVLAVTMLSYVALSAEAPTPPADGELARVVDVTDGDTIRVDVGGRTERVRYIGIDTPEIAHQAGDVDEPYGRQATRANAELVADEIVLLERDVSDTDRYDRLLRYVWVEAPEGWVMVNGALVAQGLADVRAYEPDTKHHAHLQWVEEQARAAGTGMHMPDSGTWLPGPCDVGGYVVDGCLGEPGSQNLLEEVLDFLFGG